MFISKAKYHNDVGEAYTRGLEQGFELARRLKRNYKSQSQSSRLPDSDAINHLDEHSLLSKQLVDIARNKGIDIE